MPDTHYEFLLPELDLGPVPVRASVWLVSEGTEVETGEPLLEVVAGEVSVDLPSPVCGRLVKQCVTEDDALGTGEVLAVLATASLRT